MEHFCKKKEDKAHTQMEQFSKRLSVVSFAETQRFRLFDACGVKNFEWKRYI